MNDKLYFNDIGEDISECNNLQDALEKSGLNYLVEKKNIYLEDGTLIKDKYATVKNTDNSVFGIVGKDYCVLNNSEGFDFIDDLINTYGMKLVKAGLYEKNENAFIILKMKEFDILEDKLVPYILVTNSYGGSGSVMTLVTPTINNNAIILGKYKILIRHSKNVKDRPVICEQIYGTCSAIIKNTLNLADKYYSKVFTRDKFSSVLERITGINKSISNIKRERAEKTIDEIFTRYNSPELSKYGETLWRAVLSIAGQECQRETLRDTGNSEIFLNRILSGMPLLNQFMKEVK